MIVSESGQYKRIRRNDVNCKNIVKYFKNSKKKKIRQEEEKKSKDITIS